MTDFVVQSNESSAIIESLTRAEVQDLGYEMGASFPNLAKQFREIQSVVAPPSNSSPAGLEIQFNIPKSQLLRDCMIKTVYNLGAADTLTTLVGTMPGLLMFEYIQIKSNNKLIGQFDDSYIISRSLQESVSKCSGIFKRALPLSTTNSSSLAVITVDTQRVCYTPVFFTFFESFRNHFDLNFWEQLQVNARFNSNLRFAGGNTSVQTITGIQSCTLWYWTMKLDDKSLLLLRKENMDPSRPLNMLSYTSRRETQVCSSTTQNSIRLTVTWPVFNQYVYIRDNGANTSTATTALSPYTPQNYCFPLTTFDYQLAGQYLIQNCPVHPIGNWEDESAFGSSIISTPPYTVVLATGVYTYGFSTSTARLYPDMLQKLTNRPLNLHWGLDKSRTYNSACMSFNQINFPLITVNHDTLTTAANFELVCDSESYQILTLDPSSGILNISLSV